ncbi:hypothetical protein J5751_06140 [bacterium]|nr:hypothetical protein [bacterium]
MTEKDTTKNLTEQTTPQSEVVDEGKKTRKHRTRKTRALTGLLAATLLASCGKPTARDVAKQGEKVEVIKESIEQYIKYRKEVVKRYNKLVRDSRADPDNVALKEQKAELRDEIKETDKKIERL